MYAAASSILDQYAHFSAVQCANDASSTILWGPIGDIGLRRTIYGSRDAFSASDERPQFKFIDVPFFARVVPLSPCQRSVCRSQGIAEECQANANVKTVPQCPIASPDLVGIHSQILSQNGVGAAGAPVSVMHDCTSCIRLCQHGTAGMMCSQRFACATKPLMFSSR